MLYINKITNAPSQNLILTGIPGLQINMTLRFMPRVQLWQMGLSYPGKSIQGVSVVNSVNILRQFKNNLPFGICCIRSDGLDPYTLDDFANQVSNLYLLNADDIAEIEKDWFND